MSRPVVVAQLALAVLAAVPARADDAPPASAAAVITPANAPPRGASDELRPLVAARIEGDTKTTTRTMLRIGRVALGQPISKAMVPAIAAWLLSSQLFKKVAVRLEEADGGYVLVATLDDKLSWIVAPTLYLLPQSWSFGVGFAENNLFGEDKKLLLYGQVGNQTSLFFGTYLDPAVRGSQLMLRFDVYLLHRDIIEFVNPEDAPTSTEIARATKWNFIDAGLLAGWRFHQWLTADVRFKPAYSFFTQLRTEDPSLPREKPERDGFDVTVQARLTVDRRRNRYGVTWGSYLQLITDLAVPGLDDYGYQLVAARAYHSWKLLEEHQLELRVSGGIGRHLPLHEELTLGGVGDLRGYNTDQFRGDRRATARAEYSVPLFRWWELAFRAITFYDAGYVGFHWRDPETRRYLPTQADGASWTRSDVGGGLRVFVGNVVLPLLGLDVGYGLEGKRYEVYFEVGLTDF